MKRTAKVAAWLVLGVVAIWVLSFSVDLFLVGVVIALVIRLGLVMEQRDEANHELWEALFEVARLKAAGRGTDVVDVPLFRPGKGVRP